MPLDNLVQSVELPPDFFPVIELRRLSLPQRTPSWHAEWLDCPIKLTLSGMTSPVIAISVPYSSGWCLGWKEAVLVKQADVPCLMNVMVTNFRMKRAILRVIGGNAVTIPLLKWDDLILEESVVKLVKNDFLRFLGREEWFRRHSLGFRRGYLLHGPPGNGKSSIIRAMLSTEGVTGFTMNPYDRSKIDEDRLAMLFSEAAESTPAVVILEDLDRCYPLEESQDSQKNIPLQQLLNHLDGVGSQDGIIVVATANSAKMLDPAILRRPGRFDRVVAFPNPTSESRKRFIEQIHPPLASKNLEAVLQQTKGFSFAQMREVFILACQDAIEDDREVQPEMLVHAAVQLAASMTQTDKRWNAAVGFREL